MEQVINRLRQSWDAKEELDRDEDERLGREWAMNVASVDQLLKIEQLFIDHHHDWNRFGGDEDAYGVADAFVFAICPKTDSDRQAVQDFWASVLGDKQWKSYLPDCVRAFAHGALTFWKEIESEVLREGSPNNDECVDSSVE